jgi:glutamine amidotransferase
MITVVDYGAGNLRSVTNALAKIGCEAMVTREPKDVVDAAALVFPGVGAAPDTMRSLNQSGLGEAIRQFIAEDRPVIAICVGMQVLLSSTEEGGGHEGLGVIPGVVRRLPTGLKVPHMGWNQVRQTMRHPIFKGIPDGANFYFVHSYYPEPADSGVIAGTTEYGVEMCSILVRGNLVATQFHPEKSGEIGLQLYGNFLRAAGVLS